MAKSSDETPSKPAETTTTNTAGRDDDTAPPAVSSNPSADTRGDAGTSTSEGPGHPKADIPSSEGVREHDKKSAKSDAEVPPPGERVDDEADGKITKRQE